MYPITLYTELTPNPNSVKFVADRVIFKSNQPLDFTSKEQAQGVSALAEKLFDFPYVTGVFIAAGFVSVKKISDISWDYISIELREFIREHLLKSEFAVERIPDPEGERQVSSPASAATTPKLEIEPSKYDEAIKNILYAKVKPAVESDGGAIDFVSFKDGVVVVELKGSCAGCPSSKITLKKGIERILKQELPIVKEVISSTEVNPKSFLCDGH